MNKKFSTLMAAALLAGSFSVVAQTTTEWVPVTPAQLVNGAEYVIHNGIGDSIMVNGKVSKSLYASSSEDGPVFLKSTQTSDKDSVWTLELTGKQFILTPTTKDGKVTGVNPIYAYSDILFTNTSSTPTSFSLSSEGLLAVGKNYVYAAGPKGAYGFKVDGTQEQASKFSFFMKKVAVAATEKPSGTTEINEVDGAVYVIDGDGNYIGIKSSLLKAAAGNLVATPANDFIALTPEEKKAYVWIAEVNALKSAYANTPIYLNVNANGVYTNSANPVNVTIENGVLSTATGNAEARFVTSEIQKPFEGDFYNAGFDEKDGKYFIKDANGIVLYAGNDNQVVDADGNLVGYNSNDAVKTVWALSPYETSTKGVYELRLKDKEGNFLVVDGKFVTVDNNYLTWDANKYAFKTADGIILLKAGSQYVGVVNGQLQLGGIYQATEFGLGNIQVAYITGQELLRRYGNHFTLKITYKDDYNNDVDVTGVFEGKLIPCMVSYNSGTATYNKEYDDDFMLADEKGNIIGVDTKEPLHTGHADYGYALTPITPKDYSLEPSRYKVMFRMEYTPGTADEYVDAITKIYLENLQVGLQEDSKEDVLVAAAPQYLGTQKLSISLNLGSVVDAKSWLNKPVYYTVESINKKKDNKGNYYGQWGGKVLGLNEYGDITFISPENVDLNEPEGQFAITYTGSEYTFANRENKNAATYVTLDASRLYKIDETTFAYVNGWTTPDTLSIKPVSNYSSEDGFHRISPADLNAKTYTVAMKLLNGDFLNIIENHNDKHRVGLDEENATEWRIEMPTVKLMDKTNDFLRYAADTVKILTSINYYVDGAFHDTQISDPKDKYYYPNTELQICTYILKNTDTDEYLYGKDHNESTGNAYYVCNEDEKTATRIALKEDGEDTYNLVPVYEYVPSDYGWYRYDYSLGNEMSESQFKTRTNQLELNKEDKKVIGGTTSLTGVLKDANLYEATSNDLFVIKEATAPTYKKMEQGDKIILSLKNNTENVLFEDTPFASIGNRVAHTDINPTLYVDTAYVNRVGNYAYQYLLGVNINRVDSTEDCGNPNHEHPRTVITEGRFLMSMVDSAKIEDENNVHINKFKYGNEHKLAFVPGYHQNDTLYLTNKAGEVVSKMEVGNDSYNMAKFAFKMIDEKDNEFIVELGDGYDKKEVAKGESWAQVSNVVVEPSYLRWVNGNLVVTSDINEAAHFTMEASDKEATANENITAGNVVVAGVDGAVVVKGAEGKNVIVSTILGKVVANEVVSSDNATIAAPAGVVVVSVDGESFKVVVK